MFLFSISSITRSSSIITALFIAAKILSVTAARHLNTERNVSLYPDDAMLITIGGYVNGTGSYDIVKIVIANNTHFKDRVPIPTYYSGIYNFGSAMMNNTIYTVSAHAFPTTYAYNFKADQWIKFEDDYPYHLRGNTVVATTDNKLYSMGGISSTTGVTREAFVYDLNNGTSSNWNYVSTVPTTHFYDACSVSIGNSIYLILDYQLMRSDDGAKTWNEVCTHKSWAHRFNASCVVKPDNEEIMLIGGTVGGNNSQVDVFNIKDNVWRNVASLNNGRRGAAAAVIPDGKTGTVVVCGGSTSNDDDNFARDDCEVYDWSKDEWNVAEFKLDIPRSFFAMFAVNTTAL